MKILKDTKFILQYVMNSATPNIWSDMTEHEFRTREIAEHVLDLYKKKWPPYPMRVAKRDFYYEDREV